MDTICLDLHRLINKYQAINHLILLGYNHDCADYLNITKTKSRLKKARTENNYPWINWCLNNSTNKTSPWYDAYVLGKKCDMRKIYQSDPSLYASCLKGLCRKQYKDQALRLIHYSGRRNSSLNNSFLRYIHLFDDEDFIINTITKKDYKSNSIYFSGFIKNMVKIEKYDLLYYILSAKEVPLNQISHGIQFDIIKNNRLDFLLRLYNPGEVFLSLSTIKGIGFLLALNPKINIGNFLSEHQHLDILTIKDISNYPRIQRLIDRIGESLIFKYSDFRFNDIHKLMGNILNTTIKYHLKHSSINIIKGILEAVYLYNDRDMKFIINTLKQTNCSDSTFATCCLKYNNLPPCQLYSIAKTMGIWINPPFNKHELLFALIMNAY